MTSSVGALSEAAMHMWDESDLTDDKKKWSEWTMRPPKPSVSMINTVSKFVFTFSATFVVVGVFT